MNVSRNKGRHWLKMMFSLPPCECDVNCCHAIWNWVTSLSTFMSQMRGKWKKINCKTLEMWILFSFVISTMPRQRIKHLRSLNASLRAPGGVIWLKCKLSIMFSTKIEGNNDPQCFGSSWRSMQTHEGLQNERLPHEERQHTMKLIIKFQARFINKIMYKSL